MKLSDIIMTRIIKSFVYTFFTLCMLYFIFGNNLNVKAYNQFYSAAGTTSVEEKIILFESTGDYTVQTLNYGSYSYQATESSSGININWIIRDDIDVLYVGDNSNFPWIEGTEYYGNIKIAYIDSSTDSIIWCFLEIHSGYGRIARVEDGVVLYITNLNFSDFNTELNLNRFDNSLTISSTVDIDNSFYFEKLDSNFPTNNGTSCGYVSMASLLAYYDILLNNNIINDLGNSEYSNFINNSIVNNSFNIETCLSSPGVNNNFQAFLINEIGDRKQGGLTNSEISAFITEYLNECTIISDYDVNEYFNNNYSSNENNIMAEIDAGRPVILCIDSWEFLTDENNWGLFINSGHAAIAYGYKLMSNGDIYYKCHLGWEGNVFNDAYIRPNNAVLGISIEFNENHICNDNAYIYKHNNTCSGFGLCQNHTSFQYYLDYNNGAYTCPTCNAVIYGSLHTHSYTEWEYYDRASHIEVCLCGNQGTATRVHAIRSSDASNRYARCLECNYLLNLNYDMAIIQNPYNLNFLRVSINGSYIFPSGIIVLADEDIEAYFNDTLVFYYQDDLPISQ